jgi:hypothetical protein
MGPASCEYGDALSGFRKMAANRPVQPVLGTRTVAKEADYAPPCNVEVQFYCHVAACLYGIRKALVFRSLLTVFRVEEVRSRNTRLRP